MVAPPPIDQILATPLVLRIITQPTVINAVTALPAARLVHLIAREYRGTRGHILRIAPLSIKRPQHRPREHTHLKQEDLCPCTSLFMFSSYPHRRLFEVLTDHNKTRNHVTNIVELSVSRENKSALRLREESADSCFISSRGKKGSHATNDVACRRLQDPAVDPEEVHGSRTPDPQNSLNPDLLQANRGRGRPSLPGSAVDPQGL